MDNKRKKNISFYDNTLSMSLAQAFIFSYETTIILRFLSQAYTCDSIKTDENISYILVTFGWIIDSFVIFKINCKNISFLLPPKFENIISNYHWSLLQKSKY